MGIFIKKKGYEGGGKVFPLEKLDELRSPSLEKLIPLHIDGARVFNTVVASGVPTHE